MIRKLAIAGLGAALLGCLPAVAQEMPELDGAPAPLRIPKAPVMQPKTTPAPKPAAKASPNAEVQKAVEARLARQAEAQKAEKARLEREAADIKARQAGLDARAAALDAREDGFTRREADLASQQAELARDSEDIARQLADASARSKQFAEADDAPEVPPVRTDERPATAVDAPRFRYAAPSLASARRACTQAGLEAARERNFYSAQYDEPPHFYRGRLELRGLMRLEDRRGYMIVDTVCEVDADGDAERFSFLR